MSFTKNAFAAPLPPVLTGDYKRDVSTLIEDRRQLMVALTEWFQRLEDRDALQIDMASITASKGIKFPATDVAATDANTLDDYEEGSWTPAITFATPGNLSVTYASQLAYYTKVGRKVDVTFAINTSAFTHTTAAGDLQITGLPFTVSSALSLARYQGAMRFGGITKATYTNFTIDATAGNAFLIVSAGGSGVAASTVAAADMPTGGTIVLRGSVTYFV